MTCEFAHDDGAYVLGALSPAERLAFKQHLAGCAECTRSVAALAGLPGLLGRVDAAVLEEQLVEEPPATLLPALLNEVRRGRRRRTLLTAGLAAAAAAVVVVVPIGLSQLGDEPAPPPSAESSEEPVPELRMEPIGEVPVRATVSLEAVTWGTRVGLTCTYDPDAVSYELPPEADYEIFVRTRSGRTEQVGSWRSVGGKEMTIMAATARTPAELASVEVRTTDGRVVLRLST
ncbi:anti-sigma factor family protein [Nocardioides sp.]|uniref:anti-sigma factor family protein n=1 Tax=Nocardioides sp. TaxID=35761 RepID=UPI002ED45237